MISSSTLPALQRPEVKGQRMLNERQAPLDGEDPMGSPAAELIHRLGLQISSFCLHRPTAGIRVDEIAGSRDGSVSRYGSPACAA